MSKKYLVYNRNALSETDFGNNNNINIGTRYLTDFKMYIFSFSHFSISESTVHLWHVIGELQCYLFSWSINNGVTYN